MTRLRRRRTFGIFVAALIVNANGLAAEEAPAAPPSLGAVTPAARRGFLARAQLWRPIATEGLDLLAGPNGAGRFAFNATVNCEYVDDRGQLDGMTPKFFCRTDEETLKIKYGDGNGEVYAEVVATRLFWALGFGADAVYPVRITCRRCPMDPWNWRTSQRFAERRFEHATVERKFDGVAIESEGQGGWSWPELDLVDPAAGGAPLAHREALKLLAVFVQHGDNKRAQQRLVCLRDGVRQTASEVTCERPFLLVSDLGATFGGAGKLSRNKSAKLNFEKWSTKPVFKDGPGCTGDLAGAITGDLSDPPIREAGRRFLAERLAQLTDVQIRDLFTAGRVEERGEKRVDSGRRRPVTVDDWLRAFKDRRAQIAQRRCPE